MPHRVNFISLAGGLFSAIMSAFIVQSAGNLQPDYEKLSALFLFDQINIQLPLAKRHFPQTASPHPVLTPLPILLPILWIRG